MRNPERRLHPAASGYLEETGLQQARGDGALGKMDTFYQSFKFGFMEFGRSPQLSSFVNISANSTFCSQDALGGDQRSQVSKWIAVKC